MSPAEKEKIERTPHEIVITKSCRAKVNDDTKNADFAVGDKVTMTGKYARELISLGKAVIAGSPEHKSGRRMREESRVQKLAPASDEHGGSHRAARRSDREEHGSRHGGAHQFQKKVITRPA